MGRAWTTQDEISCRADEQRFDSVEALKNPIDRSQIEIVQLGRGRISGSIVRGHVKEIAFSRGTFSLPIRASGVFSSEKVVVASLLRCSGPSRSFTEPVVPGDILVHPVGSEHDRLYEGAAAFAGLTCDPGELPGFFGKGDPLANSDFWARRQHFRSAEAPVRCCPERLMTLLAYRLRRSRHLSAASADFWKRALLDAFLSPIALAPSALSEQVIPSASRIVREVERYIEANGDRAVHVSEVCNRMKVSRRTLYRAFDDALGQGPIEFLRAKRLTAVHLKLRRGQPDSTGVSEIAMDLGFLELGRFAQQYRKRFGEYPHQTLRRNSTKHIVEPLGANAAEPSRKIASRSDDLARNA